MQSMTLEQAYYAGTLIGLGLLVAVAQHADLAGVY